MDFIKLRLSLLCCVTVIATGQLACTTNPSVIVVDAELPAEIAPAASAELVAQYRAIGVQIYECKANDATPDQFTWTLLAPQADLFDVQGNLVGQHGAGPIWNTLDGSSIRATVDARVDVLRDNSIPWLRLTVSDRSGSGTLSSVNTVLRTQTLGGKPPQSECSAATSGQQQAMYYSALYSYYR